MVLVIAECGINFQGDEAIAYKLIDAAVAAKADVAKFQLFQPELVGEHLRWLSLPREAYPRLNRYCHDKGIKFACTAFDADSLQWLLANTDMAFVKISSGKWNDHELLKAAYYSKKMVISSVKAGDAHRLNPRWYYLHVVPEYPTTATHADLKRVTAKWCCGLSDHSGDIFMPLAAVALGAQIIECHITLDKQQEGPDHKASLEPWQFKMLVEGIRAIEQGLCK